MNPRDHDDAEAQIVLVTDRLETIRNLESILASCPGSLVKVESLKDELIRLSPLDVAVILLVLPELPGLEMAALIREHPNFDHTPIIFVASKSAMPVRNDAFLGVDYVVSPVATEELREKVSELIELHRKTRLIRQQSERLRQAEEARHRRELAAVSDRLEAETKRNRFFNLALDLLGIADGDGNFLQLNPSWEQVLGYSEAELKRKSGLELVHPEDRETMRAHYEKLKRDNAPVYFEARYAFRDGSYCWLGWTAVPFVSEKLIYIFARDITRRRMAEEEIHSLNRELNRRLSDLTEVNRELESFNYSISHDLRAPLRSIASFTQVVQMQYAEALAGDGVDYLRRVENAARYMDKLLLDLLDYSRLSRSEMKLSPVSLESAVNDVVFSIDEEIRLREAKVEICGPLGFAIGHPATVRQILHNLLANALKFIAPDRPPRVRIWSEREEGFLRVFIEDNGIGIAPQYHRKIFGLFQRLHSQSRYPGTGVGLAVVQKGIERMGGRIGIESEPDRGSRFWLLLREAEDDRDSQLEFAAELYRPSAR